MNQEPGRFWNWKRKRYENRDVTINQESIFKSVHALSIVIAGGKEMRPVSSGGGAAVYCHFEKVSKLPHSKGHSPEDPFFEDA